MRNRIAVALTLSAMVALLVVGVVIFWIGLSGLRGSDVDVGPSEQARQAFDGTGRFLVGRDVAPGAYRAEGTDGGCNWAVYRGGVAVRRGEGPEQIEVTIAPDDTLFQTRGCGTWRRVPDGPPAAISSGP